MVDVPLELEALTSLISQPSSFSPTGSIDVQKAALNATKFIFDLSVSSENDSRPHVVEFLGSLAPADAPQTRSQTESKKRKRDSTPPPPPPIFEPTPITSLFTEGMDDEQLWAQLDLRLKNVCGMLDFALEVEALEEDDEDEGGMEIEDQEDEDLSGEDMDTEMAAFEDEGSEDEVEELESEEDADTDVDLGEEVASLRDPSSEDEDDLLQPPSRHKRRSKKMSELDDGFFDLSTFNAETEEAEARKVSKGRLSHDDSEDDDEEPYDLFAPVDQDPLEEDEESGALFYNDFFQAPRHAPKPSPSPKKAGSVRFHEQVRVKNIKPQGKNLPLNGFAAEEEEDDSDSDEDQDEFAGSGSDEGEDEEESIGNEDESEDDSIFDGEKSIERLKTDLFADDNDDSPHGECLFWQPRQFADPFQDLSTHERRMAELREQISNLETENVGPKDWVVMGEAGARSRPQNSLLEEDLEYERVMKAVPVVTEERVQALEDRIKARILEGRFDDVVRIRAMEDKPFLPSRLFELQDTKSSQSLAQIYESDYVAAQTGTPVDDRDGKLKKEHAEIEALWEGISAKLDALCNAHFVPKQPKAIIQSVSNVSTATMESALPTTKSATSMLAPEEVFATSTSDLRARSEMTPQEKKAARSKARKANRKSRDKLDKSVDKYAKLKGGKSVKRQKEAALAVVRTGKGVTVVGKEKARKDGKLKSK
ncbi:U3 small nucleolar ribonucleoprotein MPP10 [Mycena kentingensis (nom. inval.)]|nr:U3 small nucleolar ribonucleoprotein MPP10 [Mycena kentingensis (nom. inval.)]